MRRTQKTERMICNFIVNAKDVEGKQRETEVNKETKAKKHDIAICFWDWYTAVNQNAGQPEKSA